MLRSAASADVARAARPTAPAQTSIRGGFQSSNPRYVGERGQHGSVGLSTSKFGMGHADPAQLYSRPRPVPGLFNLRQKFNKRVLRGSKSVARFSDAQLERWINPGFASTSHRLTWDDELGRDIIAVAREAGMSTKTASMVLAAVREGRLPSNPGVLLAQALRCTSAMEQHMGRKQAQMLIQKLPALLNHCPEAMSINLAVLAPLFSKPGQLPSMLKMYPKLMLASPFTVWSNLDELSELLQIEIDGLMPLVTKHPRLLNANPSELNMRFQKLGELTQLSHLRLVKLLIRQPALLSYFHYTLAANVQNIANVLNVDLWRATALMARQPSVAMLRPDTMEAKVISLEALLKCGMMRVSFMVMKQPSLLTLSTENLERKFQRMAGTLGVSQEAATTMIVAMPALLTVTPELLETKVAGLKTVAALNPSWQQQLERATPKTLALWVCFSSKRYRRFQEACAKGITSLSMSKILKVPDKEWVKLMSS